MFIPPQLPPIDRWLQDYRNDLSGGTHAMQELVALARNLRLFVSEDKLGFLPEIEAVLTTIVKEYVLVDQDITDVQRLATIRINMRPESARQAGQRLIQFADEADALANLLEHYELKPKQETDTDA